VRSLSRACSFRLFFSIDAGLRLSRLRLMSKKNNPCPSSASSTAEFALKRAWFFGLVVLAFLLANYPAQGQNKEDDYFRIYTLIQQADSLSKNGENDPALARYQQAQADLRKFQKTYPD